MKNRKLGYSELELTTVGLGTWAIGGPWEFGWGPQDDDDSIATIREAIDNGINWIDTAPVYGLGHAEELIGRALKNVSQRPIVATKCGLVWDDKNDRVPCLKPDSLIAECESSLKRLGIDVIDLYQIHWPTNTDETLDAWDTMARLIKQGKIRYAGVSNFSLEQLQLCQKMHPIASVQPLYNILQRDVENEILGFCKDNNVGVVAYSPMARGLLTGKFSRERLDGLTDDDSRKKSSLFQEPAFSRNLEIVEKLKNIAQRNSITLAQLSVAWVLSRQEITAAIVGARRPGQIGETAQASDVELSNDDVAEIEEILK